VDALSVPGPLLIAFGGLPASGKTTISQVLARRIGAMHLRIDTIEQALRVSEWTGDDLGPLGYEVAYRVAEDNLLLGRVVLADSVNPTALTRGAWRSVAERAGARFLQVEVCCSDPVEHRYRTETRWTDIPGFRLPAWSEVLERHYEPWDDVDLRLDTSFLSATEGVERITARLTSSTAE
jgi:predicted kinase